MKHLFVANWKMHGLKSEVVFLSDIIRLLRPIASSKSNFCAESEILICPPYCLLGYFADLLSDTEVGEYRLNICLGAQNCHNDVSGSHTGSVSARMLFDIGARYVLLGHYEVRLCNGDSDEEVGFKLRRVLSEGLRGIICVGEDISSHKGGDFISFILCQLEKILGKKRAMADIFKFGCFDIAYEPIWAIGGTSPPKSSHISSVHLAIGEFLSDYNLDFYPRVLYGGSVDEKNAATVSSIEGVDGLLVGRASLDASRFASIVSSSFI